MKIEAVDIVKSYHSKKSVKVLDGISLTAKSGDFVALKGRSGSGKSTLLTILGGMLHPDSGRVLFDGEDIYSRGRNYTNEIRAGKVGFLFQQFHLVPYLSVEENILAPTAVSGLENAAEKASELIRKFDLEDRREHKPSELSTGEMQRCAMARALINSPKILLADEPTGNLDDENSGVILDALSAFAQSGGIVVLVTHDSRAAAKAGRVLNISEGKMDE